MISSSKTFCPNPWSNLTITHNGKVGVCAYSWEIGDLTKNTLEEIHNGETIQEIKDHIAQGKWHDACSYCKNSEDLGGRSDRLHCIKMVKPELIDRIDSDPSQNYLSYFSVNQSNLCNLACTYCGPNNSTTWSKKMSIPINVDRVNIDSVIEYLTRSKDNIVGFMLGGGEPLLQKHTHRILEELSIPGKQLSVALTTNLSVPLENNPVWKSIQTLGDAAVCCNWLISFDSLGDKFEYVRDGASWEIFKKNVKLLKDARQLVTAHPAYGIYSAFDLVEYCDFCVENDIMIFWCDIFSPHQLDVRFLPEKLRELAIANIDAVLNKYQNHPLVPTETLVKYREMAVVGTAFNVPDATDSERAKQILSFNDNIEKTLKKQILFADLWPTIHQQLSTIAND